METSATANNDEEPDIADYCSVKIFEPDDEMKSVITLSNHVDKAYYCDTKSRLAS